MRVVRRDRPRGVRRLRRRLGTVSMVGQGRSRSRRRVRREAGEAGCKGKIRGFNKSGSSH